MKKTIINGLKDLKNKESIVNASKERINALEMTKEYEETADDLFFDEKADDSWIIKFIKQKNSKKSYIESNLIRKEEAIKIIDKLIEKEKRENLIIELEVNQITKALESLDEKERTILKLKYIDNLTWLNVEFKYNEIYEESYITFSGLRKIANKAVDKLFPILKAFYEMQNL